MPLLALLRDNQSGFTVQNAGRYFHFVNPAKEKPDKPCALCVINLIRQKTQIGTANMLRLLIALAILAPSVSIAEEAIPARYLDFSHIKTDARPLDITKVKLACAGLASKHGVDPRTILGKYQWGCTVVDQSGVCHIRYHDKPFRDAASGEFITVWSTLRHEQAHCAGWPANHPN